MMERNGMTRRLGMDVSNLKLSSLDNLPKVNLLPPTMLLSD